MKIFLILVNLVLAGLVVREGAALVRPAAGETLEIPRRERSGGKSAEPESRIADSAQEVSDPVRTILRENIFNPTRCPDAVAGRGGGSQITLVGVYRVGECVGAIIQQKRQAVRRGPWNNNNPQQQQQPLQQFFRVGESLENGYRLDEVHADRVVLSRGGGTLELKLESASTNLPATVAAAAAAARRAQPTAQQIQQQMMFQQMRMMQQMMRQNMNGVNNNNNQAPARRNRQ